MTNIRLPFAVSVVAHTLLIGLTGIGGPDITNTRWQGERTLTLTILPAPRDTDYSELSQLNIIAPKQQTLAPTVSESFKMLSDRVVPRVEEPVRTIVVAEAVDLAPTTELVPMSLVHAPASASNPETTEAALAGDPVQTGASARAAYRNNPQPAYPLAARRRGQEGLVTLRVKVTSGGEAEFVELKESSGYPLLDDAAISAVRGWEFEPARLNGSEVASEVDVPVRFSLTD